MGGGPEQGTEELWLYFFTAIAICVLITVFKYYYP